MRQARGFKGPEGAAQARGGRQQLWVYWCYLFLMCRCIATIKLSKGQHIYFGANGMSIHAYCYVTDFVCMNIVSPLNCEGFSSIITVSQ